MEENLKTEDFEFAPPEFEMSFAEEMGEDMPVFTAPSVENTLEENVSFEAPSFENTETPTVENIEEKNEIVEEAPSDINQAETIDVQPITEESFEFAPQFESPEMVVPDFEASGFEVADEFETPPEVENFVPDESVLDETAEVQDVSFEMPNEEEVVFDVQQIDAQNKIANAIREKMSEMQEVQQDAPSFNIPFDMPENNDEMPSFEPVTEAEVEISMPTESLQTEPVEKEDMFAEGIKKLKNIIKNESTQLIDMMKDNTSTK